MGFVEGEFSCARIDLDEVEKRRGDLPIILGTDQSGHEQTGEAAIDGKLVTTLVDQLNEQFTPSKPPTVSITPPRSPAPMQSPPWVRPTARPLTRSPPTWRHCRSSAPWAI